MEHGFIERFVELIFSHALLAIGTVVFLLVLRRLVPKIFAGVYRRFSVLYPVAFATGCAFLPGLSSFAEPSEKVFAGIIVGWLASVIFVIFKPVLIRLLPKAFPISEEDAIKAAEVLDAWNQTTGKEEIVEGSKVKGYDR